MIFVLLVINHNLKVKSIGSGVRELITVLAYNFSNKCNFSKPVKIKILRIPNSVLVLARSTCTKTGMIQGRSVWPLHKDDTTPKFVKCLFQVFF